MKSMPRLILTDLDHTLLHSDGSLSAYTLRVLDACRRRGLLLAVATARYWIGAEPYLDALRPDYEITTDGTLVHARGECIYSCAFPAGTADALLRALLARHPGALITAASGKTVYWNSPHIALSERLHKAVFCDYSAPLGCPVHKIAAELPSEAVAREIAARFPCRLVAYRGENMYAFLPPEAGKTAALRAVSAASGIPAADTVAFGDDRNDLEMLQCCGTGVAVANALPGVLEAAGEITDSNDMDGVARWLERRCLNP